MGNNSGNRNGVCRYVRALTFRNQVQIDRTILDYRRKGRFVTEHKCIHYRLAKIAARPGAGRMFVSSSSETIKIICLFYISMELLEENDNV